MTGTYRLASYQVTKAALLFSSARGMSANERQAGDLNFAHASQGERVRERERESVRERECVCVCVCERERERKRERERERESEKKATVLKFPTFANRLNSGFSDENNRALSSSICILPSSALCQHLHTQLRYWFVCAAITWRKNVGFSVPTNRE